MGRETEIREKQLGKGEGRGGGQGRRPPAGGRQRQGEITPVSKEAWGFRSLDVRVWPPELEAIHFCVMVKPPTGGLVPEAPASRQRASDRHCLPAWLPTVGLCTALLCSPAAVCFHNRWPAPAGETRPQRRLDLPSTPGRTAEQHSASRSAVPGLGEKEGNRSFRRHFRTDTFASRRLLRISASPNVRACVLIWFRGVGVSRAGTLYGQSCREHFHGAAPQASGLRCVVDGF